MINKICAVFENMDRDTEFNFKLWGVVSFFASLVLMVLRMTFLQAESEAGLIFELIVNLLIALGFCVSIVGGVVVLGVWLAEKRAYTKARCGSSLTAYTQEILIWAIMLLGISVYIMLIGITAEWFSIFCIKLMTICLTIALGGCIIALVVVNNRLGVIESLQTKDGDCYTVDKNGVLYIEIVRTGFVCRADSYTVAFETKPNLLFYKDEIDTIVYENGSKRRFE